MKRRERLVGRAICAVLAFWLTAAPAPAGSDSDAKPPAVPESWELSPYRVHVLVRVSPAADWPLGRRQRLIARLTPRAAQLLGGLWSMTVAAAPANFPWGQAVDSAGVGLDAVPAAELEADKLLLLDIQPSG